MTYNKNGHTQQHSQSESYTRPVADLCASCLQPAYSNWESLTHRNGESLVETLAHLRKKGINEEVLETQEGSKYITVFKLAAV